MSGRIRGMVAALLIGVPPAAAAQHVTITPTVGTYVPLADQGRWRFDFCPSDSTAPCLRDLRHTELDFALATGIRVQLQWEGFGLEASVTTAATTRHSTSITFNPRSRTRPHVTESAARTTVAGLRFTLWRPLGPGAEATLGVGPAITLLSGSDGAGSVSDRSISGVTLAAGLEFTLSRRVRFEMGTSHYVYDVLSVASDPWTSESRAANRQQHAFVFSAGIGLVMGH